MNSTEISALRAQAHHLNPVVLIGQAGLTAGVLAEIEIALNVHELIKIKIRAEKEERLIIGTQICAETKAELVQTIGGCWVIYRFNPDKKKPTTPINPVKKTVTKRGVPAKKTVRNSLRNR